VLPFSTLPFSTLPFFDASFFGASFFLLFNWLFLSSDPLPEEEEEAEEEEESESVPERPRDEEDLDLEARAGVAFGCCRPNVDFRDHSSMHWWIQTSTAESERDDVHFPRLLARLFLASLLESEVALVFLLRQESSRDDVDGRPDRLALPGRSERKVLGRSRARSSSLLLEEEEEESRRRR